ncbi:hypothetical protein [Hyphomicrobium sp. ghe19]|uniref:hypothetical protein n=1 Tax=Hyphomicrobium sp. ghe19 TaxID=2682968 RepID=UPI001367186E|nr:hypothetical protein HYPP_03748 [Hyphomicrobium sp. ghe19]
MPYTLKNKIVAVPVPLGSYALSVAGVVLEEGGRLVLGTAPEKLELLKGEFRGEPNVFCQRLNSNSAQSFRAFFKQAYSRFGRPDVLVLRAISSEHTSLANQMEHASRELLLWMDALALWIGKEVHIIVIAPAFLGRALVSIATEFFKLKFVTTQPVIRITTVATAVQADGVDAMASRIIMPTSNQSNALPILRTKSGSSANAPRINLQTPCPKNCCPVLGPTVHENDEAAKRCC